METKKVCLDSSFLIDFIRGNQKAKSVFQEYHNACFYTTEITLYEIAYGTMIKSKGKEFNIILELMDRIKIIPMMSQFALVSAKIRAILSKKGNIIEDTDCLIAGIMQSQGITTIITKNKKHFSRIPGIKVVSY